MVEKKPVSVNWQTLFILIPIIDLWATYRVEKLGLYILLIIALAVVGFIVGFVEGFLFFGMSDFFSWIVVLVGVVISIILIRKWSKEWNEKCGMPVVSSHEKPQETRKEWICEHCGFKSEEEVDLIGHYKEQHADEKGDTYHRKYGKKPLSPETLEILTRRYAQGEITKEVVSDGLRIKNF